MTTLTNRFKEVLASLLQELSTSEIGPECPTLYKLCSQVLVEGPYPVAVTLMPIDDIPYSHKAGAEATIENINDIVAMLKKEGLSESLKSPTEAMFVKIVEAAADGQ
jgi:hypothetical protein